MSEPTPPSPADHPAPLEPGAGSVFREPPTPPAAPAEPLSPEEQMARYAAALKEADWGHQPC